MLLCFANMILCSSLDQQGTCPLHALEHSARCIPIQKLANFGRNGKCARPVYLRLI